AGLGRGGIRARGPAPARFSPALSAAPSPALSLDLPPALSATLLPAPSPGPFSRSSPRTVLSPRCRAASRKQLHHRYRAFDHVRVDSNTEAIEGVVRVADTATGGADGSRSADGFDDPGALALAEDFASGLVMAENRSAAERCRGVHTVYLRHEERVRAHLAEAPPGEPEWAQLDPFEHACQSLVAVTGVSYARSQDMVLLAIDVHDWAGPVLDAMASGLMCERIAMLLCRKVRGVDDPLRAEVLAAVVADYLRRLRDGERPSRQATSRNAGKIVADLDPEGVARRREDAAFTRAVRFRKDDDEGMCTITARLTSAAGALL